MNEDLENSIELEFLVRLERTSSALSSIIEGILADGAREPFYDAIFDDAADVGRRRRGFPSMPVVVTMNRVRELTDVVAGEGTRGRVSAHLDQVALTNDQIHEMQNDPNSVLEFHAERDEETARVHAEALKATAEGTASLRLDFLAWIEQIPVR